jgi:hypothetical protein
VKLPLEFKIGSLVISIVKARSDDRTLSCFSTIAREPNLLISLWWVDIWIWQERKIESTKVD